MDVEIYVVQFTKSVSNQKQNIIEDNKTINHSVFKYKGLVSNNMVLVDNSYQCSNSFKCRVKQDGEVI